MLIDSNILIYSLVTDSPKNKVAQDFLRSQVKKTTLEKSIPMIAHQNIFEVLRVITHTKFPSPFSSAQAIDSINAICSVAKIIYPTRETQALAIALIQKYNISGSEIFDAYLVATAIDNDCFEIATDNEKHLCKYSEITVFNPFS